jgi:hypothetical protein
MMSDKALIDFVHRAHFEWFRKNHHPRTGLVFDRDLPGAPASIAATGFGLSAYIVAAERGWVTKAEALQYARKTLSCLSAAPQGEAVSGMSGYLGMFYHFLDPETGTRATAPKFWNSELSTIDTTLLVAGIMFARSYFNSLTDDEEFKLRHDADLIIDRVQWDRFVREDNLILHAWTPEVGMWKPVYRGYSEALLLYVIALGSKRHGVPAKSWNAFIVDAKVEEVYGQKLIPMPGMPLFCYQYPQCFVDFRGIKDAVTGKAGFDYHENAIRVARAQHAYAIANPNAFVAYSALDWGLTASDGPGNVVKVVGGRQVQFRGYSERGSPNGFDDGTLAPTAALSSVAYAPDVVLPTLRHWLKTRPELFSPDLGFVDAFNPSFDQTPSVRLD